METRPAATSRRCRSAACRCPSSRRHGLGGRPGAPAVGAAEGRVVATGVAVGRARRRSLGRSGLVRAGGLFAASYLAVWTAFGAIALAAWAAITGERSTPGPDASAVALLIGAVW